MTLSVICKYWREPSPFNVVIPMLKNASVDVSLLSLVVFWDSTIVRRGGKEWGSLPLRNNNRFVLHHSNIYWPNINLGMLNCIEYPIYILLMHIFATEHFKFILLTIAAGIYHYVSNYSSWYHMQLLPSIVVVIETWP